MQLKIFTIPAFDNTAATDEMNRFLRSHTVVDIEKQFISNGNNSFWSFCVRYMSVETSLKSGQKEKVDYKELLDPVTFAKFSLLRDCRKEIAQRDSVPVYLVFTNEELANIAKMSDISIAAAQKIHGIGAKRFEKYGAELIEMYQLKSNETSN